MLTVCFFPWSCILPISSPDHVYCLFLPLIMFTAYFSSWSCLLPISSHNCVYSLFLALIMFTAFCHHLNIYTAYFFPEHVHCLFPLNMYTAYFFWTRTYTAYFFSWTCILPISSPEHVYCLFLLLNMYTAYFFPQQSTCTLPIFPLSCNLCYTCICDELINKIYLLQKSFSSPYCTTYILSKKYSIFNILL